MVFGLCTSPATYARVINLVLRGLNWKVVLPFLDDILVLGKDFAGHLANLRAVLDRFREHGSIQPHRFIGCISVQYERFSRIRQG
jgi:hypothetical protein